MLKSKTYNNSFSQIAVMLLLFMAMLNVFNKMVYLIFAAFLALFIFVKEKLLFNNTSIALIFFSFCLIIFSEGTGITNNGIVAAIRTFMYPLIYIVGYNIYDEKSSDDMFQKFIIFVGMGPFLHYVLNMFINTDPSGRNTKDFWSSEVFSATGQATLCSIAIGIFAALIYSKRNWVYKLFAFTGIISILVYNLILAGRTSLGLIAIALVIGLGYYCVLNRNKRFKTILSICTFVLLLILAIKFNWFGIGDLVMDSNFFHRFTEEQSVSDSSGRNDFKLEYLRYLLVYPFGGGKIDYEVGNYAHDLLLDLYSDAGIFSTIIIIVILINSIRNNLRVLRSDKFSNDAKMLVFCVYTMIYIQFFLEPIILGMTWLLAIFLLYNGLLERRLELLKNEE